MTRAAALAAVFAALALSAGACGGDGGGSDRSGRSGDGPTAEGSNGEGRDSGGETSGSRPAGDSSSTAPAELGDRYRPQESDRKIQGDGSIERFGEALPDEEAEEVVAVAVGYHDAGARGDWARACELLSSESRETLEALAEQAPRLKGKDCAAVMGALYSTTSRAKLAREAKSMRFNEVRAEGDRAFAIFKSKTIPHGAQPLVREDGQWRIAAMSPAPL